MKNQADGLRIMRALPRNDVGNRCTRWSEHGRSTAEVKNSRTVCAAFSAI
jgi:hypothetical protein